MESAVRSFLSNFTDWLFMLYKLKFWNKIVAGGRGGGEGILHTHLGATHMIIFMF